MSLLETAKAQFAPHLLATRDFRQQQTIVIKKESALGIARTLRDDPRFAFDFLMDLSAVDYLRFGKRKSSSPTFATPSPLPFNMTAKPVTEVWERGVSNDNFRFEVVYHLYSSTHNHRLRVSIPLKAAEVSVASVVEVWDAANWFEREAWDMYGVNFEGHPDLRRLLMYEAFEGHPLRKDYRIDKRQPLIGPTN